MNMYFTGHVIVEESRPGQIHPALEFGIPTIIRRKPEHYVYVPFNRKHLSPKKKRVLLRDGYRCQYCDVDLRRKNKNATIDHVIPKSHKDYPGHIWTNLVACCHSCNNSKGNKTPKEAGMLLIKEPDIPKIEDLVFSDKPDLLEAVKRVKERNLVA